MLPAVNLGGPGVRRSRLGEIDACLRMPATETGQDVDTGAPIPELADKRTKPSDQDTKSSEKALAALARQQQKFNQMVMERSELEREQEALDTLLLAQLKHDDEVLKEWIRLA